MVQDGGDASKQHETVLCWHETMPQWDSHGSNMRCWLELSRLDLALRWVAVSCEIAIVRTLCCDAVATQRGYNGSQKMAVAAELEGLVHPAVWGK